MKKIILGFLTIVSANKSFPQTALEKTLLWQVTGPGIQQPSYLYGTIHVLCTNDLVVDSIITEKFNSTQQLFLELDMDDMKTLTGAMQGMMMKDNITLHDLLDKEMYDTVAANFEKLTKIPFAFVGRIKPMMAMSFIFPAILGCEPEAWEQKLVQMAKEKNIPVNGLETVQQQIDVLDSIPLKIQADMLAKSLKDVDSLKQSFNQMLELYKTKDIDSLYKQTESEEDFSNYEGVLIQERNSNWVSKIISEAIQKPTFFAFGAAHLAGQYGVINLLRDKGYTVTAVIY
ncbi:MAG: TraB/GumN family protein [Parafilimonas sp.]